MNVVYKHNLAENKVVFKVTPKGVPGLSAFEDWKVRTEQPDATWEQFISANTFTFDDLTPEQKAELKGDKGDALTFDDLTPEQKLELKGDKGDALTFDDLTPEQKLELKGDKGDALTFDDLTPAQKAELKGDKGDKGDNGTGFTQITETSRIALTPSNNLPYWQTDGAIGGYYWRDGAWSFLGAKKKKTIATSTYTVNPIIDVGYLLEFTNDCVVSVPNGNIASGNTIDMLSVDGKTITLQNSGTMALANVIPTQSLVSVLQETIVSVMYTSSNKGLVAGGLM